MMSSSGGYSSSIVIERFLYSLTESTDYVAGAYIIDQEHGRFSGYAQPKANVKVDHVRELYEEGFFDIVRDTQWCTDEDGNIYVRRDIYNSYPYKKIGYIIVSIDIQEFLALVGISPDSETTAHIEQIPLDIIGDIREAYQGLTGYFRIQLVTVPLNIALELHHRDSPEQENHKDTLGNKPECNTPSNPHGSVPYPVS